MALRNCRAPPGVQEPARTALSKAYIDTIAVLLNLNHQWIKNEEAQGSRLLVCYWYLTHKCRLVAATILPNKCRLASATTLPNKSWTVEGALTIVPPPILPHAMQLAGLGYGYGG
jgi:hypothetical protein